MDPFELLARSPDDLPPRPEGGGCIVLGDTGDAGTVSVTLLDGMDRPLRSQEFAGGTYRFDKLADGNYKVRIGGTVKGPVALMGGMDPSATLNFP
jgi:hypothetical protein